MTDLPDRILEAIALVAQNAEELKAVQPTLMRIGLSTPDGRSLVVSSDPSADLRRCEADKRTVELHVPNWSVIADSPYVDAGGNPVPPCKHCKWSWPCPDLLDRADAYGVAPGPLTED